MRFHAEGALLFLLLYMTAISVALAQQKRASSNGADRVTREPTVRQHKPIASRPLTLSEGLAILGAALDSRHSQADFSADCSHFVHGLYERAGFVYEYASSSDLYEGTDEFRRVTSPQPGDLAVWRGHAGIVVNPDQHSFFSVLHSGPRCRCVRFAILETAGTSTFLPLPQTDAGRRGTYINPDCEVGSPRF